MPFPIAFAHFDAAVNTGVRQAAKLLQRAAGVEDDGRIGAITLGAVRAADERRLLEDMLWQRGSVLSHDLDSEAARRPEPGEVLARVAVTHRQPSGGFCCEGSRELVGRDYRFMEVNRRLCDLLGYTTALALLISDISRPPAQSQGVSHD